ncbi:MULTISPECIES: hypothetical protein [unclassified Isoptericola]|uniref:hypothetical protein n=1 Tax=unclassified Isoptericola TaxID=2623355 RepID=UPI00365512FF
MDQIFVFVVEDADASGWRAELGVVASDKAAAVRRLRDGGVRKSQFRGGLRPDRVMSLSEVALAGLTTGTVVRRRDDDGWTPWELVADDRTLNWRRSGRFVSDPRGGIRRLP